MKVNVLSDSQTKFPYLGKQIDENKFNIWTTDNEYRTNYNDMKCRVIFPGNENRHLCQIGNHSSLIIQASCPA